MELLFYKQRKGDKMIKKEKDEREKLTDDMFLLLAEGIDRLWAFSRFISIMLIFNTIFLLIIIVDLKLLK